MITASSNRIEYHCPHDSLPDFNKSNYYTIAKYGEIKFAEKPTYEYNFIAVPQGSAIIDLETLDIYFYIIDSIDEKTGEQTGHWYMNEE